MDDTKPKRTPWFPASVKPVRKGYYETRIFVWGALHSSYWDGRAFNYDWSSSSPCMVQDREWRGLSTNPESRHG